MAHRTVRQYEVGWDRWLAYMEGTTNVFIGDGPLAFHLKSGTTIIRGSDEITQLIDALTAVRDEIADAERKVVSINDYDD